MQVHAPRPRVAKGHYETMTEGLCDWETCPTVSGAQTHLQNSQLQIPPAQPLPSKWVTELALPCHLLRAGCWVSPGGGDTNPARCCVRSPRPW